MTENIDPEAADQDLVKGKHLRNFSWTEGYDGEYEYSVDVYQNCIVWHLEFDEQWRDPPRDSVQYIDDFLQNGPPADFENLRRSDEIADFIKMKKRV